MKKKHNNILLIDENIGKFEFFYIVKSVNILKPKENVIVLKYYTIPRIKWCVYHLRYCILNKVIKKTLIRLWNAKILMV